MQKCSSTFFWHTCGSAGIEPCKSAGTYWPLTRPWLMILASLLPHFLAFQSSFVQSLPGHTLSWTFSMVGFKYSCAKFGIGMSGPCHSPRIFFSAILSANACALFHPLFLFFLALVIVSKRTCSHWRKFLSHLRKKPKVQSQGLQFLSCQVWGCGVTCNYIIAQMKFPHFH